MNQFVEIILKENLLGQDIKQVFMKNIEKNDHHFNSGLENIQKIFNSEELIRKKRDVLKFLIINLISKEES